MADRLGFRDRLKANRALGLAYRLGVGIVGFAVLLLGLFLIPFPGPGWLVVFLGLGILATEFAWAERLLGYARHQLSRWTRWLRHQNLGTRLLLGASTAAIALALAFGYVAWRGVPFVAD